MYSVEINNVRKSYGDVEALKGVSVQVLKGELFGIIGPDGAGKTTLFRLLTTLLVPDGGSITVDGFDTVSQMTHIRRRVGYMPGRFSLYQDLTVEENIKFFATLFGTTIEQNYDLIRDIYVQIEPFKKRRAGALSGGMKQKLALCCALIHEPSVLFLDEPTTGVDPVSRKEFWGMLQRLRSRGITILVSTPYMDEASLCDRIALIRSGKFLQVDTPQNIVDSFRGDIWAVRGERMARLLVALRQCDRLVSSFSFGDTIHVRPLAGLTPEELFLFAAQQGHSDVSVSVINPSVEDCFMALTSG